MDLPVGRVYYLLPVCEKSVEFLVRCLGESTLLQPRSRDYGILVVIEWLHCRSPSLFLNLLCFHQLKVDVLGHFYSLPQVLADQVVWLAVYELLEAGLVGVAVCSSVLPRRILIIIFSQLDVIVLLVVGLWRQEPDSVTGRQPLQLRVALDSDVLRLQIALRDSRVECLCEPVTCSSAMRWHLVHF